MKPLEQVLTVALRSHQMAEAQLPQAQLKGQLWTSHTWSRGSMEGEKNKSSIH